MSTTTNHQASQLINNQTVLLSALPASKGDKEALFQVGMSGLVSAALLEVQKIFTEIANLMGKQFISQIEAAKTTADTLAKNQIDQGAEQAKQQLIGGLTTIGGSALSLGTIIGGEVHGRMGDNFGLKETDQQLKGLKGYKDELSNRTTVASINEHTGPSEIEMQDLSVDHKEIISTRAKSLSSKNNFIDADKKAHIVAEQKGADGTEISDKDVIKDMTEEQASDFSENLESQEKIFLKQRDDQLGKQSSLRTTLTTFSQGLSQVISGSGTAGASVHAANAAKEQASMTESQAALDGFKQVSMISQGQFSKLIDEAKGLSDNLKAIANANALIGG